MEIIEAFATANKCYQGAAPLTPRGIMWHSIGVPQPNASVMAHSYNQYRPNGQSVCVHAFCAEGWQSISDTTVDCTGMALRRERKQRAHRHRDDRVCIYRLHWCIMR